MIEVPHPNQTVEELQDKLDELDELLGELAGPGSYVTPPVSR